MPNALCWMESPMRWRDYQEDVAKFFRQLDCDAKVDARVQGARARHNIDVWVTFSRFGLEHKWVIECKLYNKPAPSTAGLNTFVNIHVHSSSVHEAVAENGIITKHVRGMATYPSSTIQFSNIVAPLAS